MSLVNRYSKQLIGIAGVASLLVLWQLAGFLNILPKFVLPTPLEIGTAFVRDRVLLMHHSLSTLQVALIGLVIGVLLAAGFAILMDSFQWVNDLVYPSLFIIEYTNDNSLPGEPANTYVESYTYSDILTEKNLIRYLD